MLTDEQKKRLQRYSNMISMLIWMKDDIDWMFEELSDIKADKADEYEKAYTEGNTEVMDEEAFLSDLMHNSRRLVCAAEFFSKNRFWMEKA